MKTIKKYQNPSGTLKASNEVRKPWLSRFKSRMKDKWNNYKQWSETTNAAYYPWWKRYKVSQQEIDEQNHYNELNKDFEFIPKFKSTLGKYSRATLDYAFNGIINNHAEVKNNPEYAEYLRSAWDATKNKQFYVGKMTTGKVAGYYSFNDKKARVEHHPARYYYPTVPDHELVGHGTEEYLSNNLAQPYVDFLNKYHNENTGDWGEIRASAMQFRRDLIRRATRFRPWRRRNPEVLTRAMQRSLARMSDKKLDKQWRAVGAYTKDYDINSGYIKDLRNLLTNAYKCGGVIRKLRQGGVPYDLEETTVTPSRNGIRTNSKTSNVQGNPEPAPARPSVPNVTPTVNATSKQSTVKHTVRPQQNSASEMPWYAPRQSHKPEEPVTESAQEVTQEQTQEDQVRQRLKALGYTDEEIDRTLNGSQEVVEEPQYRSTEGLTRGEFRTKDAKYYKPEELYDWLQKEYFRVTDIDDIDSMRTYNLVNYSLQGVFGDEFKNWFSDNHQDLVQKLYNSATYQFDQTIAPYKNKIKFIGTSTTGSPTYSKANNTIYFNPSLEYLQELKDLIQETINNQTTP